jgi:hypothetical protein
MAQIDVCPRSSSACLLQLVFARTVDDAEQFDEQVDKLLAVEHSREAAYHERRVAVASIFSITSKTKIFQKVDEVAASRTEAENSVADRLVLTEVDTVVGEVALSRTMSAIHCEALSPKLQRNEPTPLQRKTATTAKNQWMLAI